MSQEYDPEKGELEKHNEKIEPSEDDSPTSVELPRHALSSTEPVIAASGVVQRDGKETGQSHADRLSDDSQRSLSEAHDHRVATPGRSRSRAHSSTRSTRREASKVPRHERRGLLARFCTFAEITNPYDYTRRQKWLITFIVAVAGAAAPMGSSLILPALTDITDTFHSRPTVVNLSVALYLLSMSIFPLWWSSFSETLGRRSIYVVSFLLFALFNALGAVSVNVGMFVAMRMLSGGAAASVQAVGAGTIADIWEVKERGRAMSIFYLGPLAGPLLSPIIGGSLAQSLGWRSAQWFLTIFGAVVLVFIIVCLPETLQVRKKIAATAEAEAIADAATANEQHSGRPHIARTKTPQSVQIKTRKFWAIFRRIFFDPLRIILYCQFPAVAICVYYSSVTFAVLYVLNISIQQTFSVAPYNYSSTVIGALYLPNSLGYFLAAIYGGKWVDQIMHREARKAGRYDEKGKLIFRPEDRMKENAWLGAIMWPCALIVYGWCARYGVFVAVPMVANFFFGIGSMLIFALITTMLTEFMPRKASNGVALNNFVRNIWSCIGAMVTEPLIVAIGNGWLFTGLGIIALVSGSVCIWAMKRYGDRWRETMDKRMDEVMGD